MTPDTAAESVRRIHVIQGDFSVSRESDVMLTTILGSCVAACMRDPEAGVGGMNHFLLPDGGNGDSGPNSMRYGVHAMELLINALLREGAKRHRLEAKLFGGGRMVRGLTDVGESNARFAEGFLQREGVTLMGGSLRGDRGRRIQYWPVSGRARQTLIDPTEHQVFERERRYEAPKPAVQTGTLELF